MEQNQKSHILLVLFGWITALVPLQTTVAQNALAELPHWPYGLPLPEGAQPAKPPKSTPILVWTPEGMTRVRSILLVIANSDSKEFAQHAKVREVAARHDMAIVYLRNFDYSRKNPEYLTPIAAILESVAKETGLAGFDHAPWITFGKSSVGTFPFHMAWLYPERTVASIVYHGETPTWPVPDWGKLDGSTVLHVSVNGETEWGGTWFRHVRLSLLNYRSRTAWLPHQVVVRGVGHGDYPDVGGSPGWGKLFPDRVTCADVWDYLALFIEKALDLRMPKSADPVNTDIPMEGPVSLRQVDPSTGWLIAPHAVEDTFDTARHPLDSDPDGYRVGGAGEAATMGYARIAPAHAFEAPDGVPVSPLRPGISPSRWLVGNALPFPMSTDPMENSQVWHSLRPAPGTRISVDGSEVVFQALEEGLSPEAGGILLKGGVKKTKEATLFAYTVLQVDAPGAWKLKAPFTPAGRLQVILNGVPVRDRQVLELDKGLYPMLVILRVTTDWASIEPNFEISNEDEVAQARASAVDLANAELSLKKRRAAPSQAVARPFAEVPESERSSMFWIPDEAMAKAWLQLHKPRPKDEDSP